MTQSRNTLLQVLPWGLTAIVTVVAVVGWIQYRGARKKLRDFAASAVTQEAAEPAAEPSDEPERAPRAKEVRRPSESGADPADPQVCLALPDVQKEIRKQANALAADLSLQQVEDFKKDEQGKRIQRRQQFMDNFETASANAVNAYAREAELDETRTVKLHQQMEDGIKKQREMFAKVQSGELTEREAREKGRQMMDEGRTAVVELLGEQGSERFFKVLGEEMRKEFENQENGMREGPP